MPLLAHFARNLPLWTEAIILWDARTTDLRGTTIPSAYYTSRSSPEMIEKRDRTRKWWSEAAPACELVSSPVVFVNSREADPRTCRRGSR